MTWRSCADDPPDQGKWVLVRYSILYHGRLHPYSYKEACWNWNSYKQQREWVDADGFLLPKKHSLADDDLTWTELPK
jgi:hypothetical protein